MNELLLFIRVINPRSDWDLVRRPSLFILNTNIDINMITFEVYTFSLLGILWTHQYLGRVCKLPGVATMLDFYKNCIFWGGGGWGLSPLYTLDTVGTCTWCQGNHNEFASGLKFLVTIVFSLTHRYKSSLWKFFIIAATL